MEKHIHIKLFEEILLLNLNSILEMRTIPDGKLIDKKDIIHSIMIKKDFHIRTIKNEIVNIINNKRIKEKIKHINTIELYLCDELLDKDHIMKMIFKINKDKIIYYKFKKDKSDIINNKLKEIYNKYVFYRCDIVI